MVKDTQERAKSARTQIDLFEAQRVEVNKAPDFEPTSDAVAAFREATKPGTPRKREPLPRTSTEKPSKRRKKSDSERQPSGAAQSRYNRNKSVLPGHPKILLLSNRQQAREVADFLYQRCYSFDDPLMKLQAKILNCSQHGLFVELPSKAAKKAGQALCKTRVCPICQRVLSVKRKKQFIAFVQDNIEQLKGYRFYHMVLTLRHSTDLDVRTHFYFEDLLRYFKELRGVTGGKATAQRLWWDKRVAGGFYSVEVTPSADGTAHIHLHILLAAKMPLWRADRSSEFLKDVRSWWMERTARHDVNAVSTQVHVEPVFTWAVDEESGEPLRDKKGEKIKNFVSQLTFEEDGVETGPESFAHLQEAVAECAKYTMKADAAALENFSDEMLRELLLTQRRYHGRFGIFHAKHPEAGRFKNLDRLNSDFVDLTEADAREAELHWCPVEQRRVPKSDARRVITSFRNTLARQGHGDKYRQLDASGKREVHNVNYYEFRDPTKLLEVTDKQQAMRELAKTIYLPYDAATDLPDNELGEAQ